MDPSVKMEQPLDMAGVVKQESAEDHSTNTNIAHVGHPGVPQHHPHQQLPHQPQPQHHHHQEIYPQPQQMHQHVVQHPEVHHHPLPAHQEQPRQHQDPGGGAIVEDQSVKTEDKQPPKPEVKSNPWSVKSLDDFLHYCCPECDCKSQNKQSFMNHVILSHPEGMSTLSQTVNVADFMNNEDTEEMECKPDVFDDEYGDGGEYDEYDEYDYIPPIKKSKPTRRRRKIDNSGPTDIQCYFCGEMLTKGQVIPHMKDKHGFGFVKPGNGYGPPKDYQCDKCKGMFDTDEDRKTHVCHNLFELKRQADGLFHCPECKTKKCKRRYELVGHFKTVHSTARNFACDQCDYKFKSMQVLKKHVKQVHLKVVKHVCPHCGRGFFEKAAMNAHVEAIHSRLNIAGGVRATNESGETVEEFKCPDCPKVCNSSKSLSCHYKVRHLRYQKNDDQEDCNVCGKRIHALWMEEHKAMDHPDPAFMASLNTRCHECHKTFYSAMELSVHIGREHSLSDVITYRCHLCRQPWRGSNALRKHLAEAHKKQILLCEECPFASKFKTVMNAHREEKHGEQQSGSQSHPCGMCGLPVIRLDQHMERKHPEYWRPCKECRLVLEGPEDYSDHMVTVHGIDKDDVKPVMPIIRPKKKPKESKPCLCPICGKSLCSEFILQKHIEGMHKGIKEFKCDMCDFSTSYHGGLTRHREAQHLKSVTYYCDKCSFKCHHIDNLNNHVRFVHDKVKPFKCEFCAMAYSYSRDLAKHKTRVHGQVPQ